MLALRSAWNALKPAAGREKGEDPARFDGKRILVTGAGKGIGNVTVKALRERGATVVALSRSATDLAALQAETGCEALAVDLADAKATRAAPGGGMNLQRGVSHLLTATHLTSSRVDTGSGLAISLPGRRQPLDRSSVGGADGETGDDVRTHHDRCGSLLSAGLWRCDDHVGSKGDQGARLVRQPASGG